MIVFCCVPLFFFRGEGMLKSYFQLFSFISVFLDMGTRVLEGPGV